MSLDLPVMTSDDGETTRWFTNRLPRVSETTRLWLYLFAVDVLFGVLAFVLDVLGGPGAGPDTDSRLLNLVGALLGTYVLLATVVLLVAGSVLFAGWVRNRLTP